MTPSTGPPARCGGPVAVHSEVSKHHGDQRRLDHDQLGRLDEWVLPGFAVADVRDHGRSDLDDPGDRLAEGLEGRKNDTSTHDVGFVIMSSFGNGFRLSTTDALPAGRPYHGRFAGYPYNVKVGCIRSWDGGSSDFKVIIDNMMNLEILFWASKHGGSSAWYDMAVSHALRTMTEHVRADGSTYQVVNYDPKTGAVKAKSTNQGAGTESTWSRGQAWAIHGFTTAYRETGDQRFLDTARRTADYFIQHLPTDLVPYWDFEAPGIPNEPRDSSAGAVAAAGLLELGRLESDPARAATYIGAADAIVTSLSSSAYLSEGTGNRRSCSMAPRTSLTASTTAG